MSGIGPISPALPVNMIVGPVDPRYVAPFVGSTGFTTIAFASAFRVDAPITVTRVRLYVGATSAGNIDIGIYNDAGTKLGSTGSFACPPITAGAGQALLAPVILLPGVRYWSVFMSDSATAQFAQVKANSLSNNGLDTLAGYATGTIPLAVSMPASSFNGALPWTILVTFHA